MNVIEIVFSPTGGTEKVAHIISRRWNENAVRIDLSDAKTDFTKCKIDKEDMVLIAMPSFGGRAPAVAIERLKQIAGNGAKCTIVCVYGNRAYEDTLIELKDTAEKSGFCVIGAIAAIAEHSIMHQYAANRPDQDDIIKLQEFSDRILQKAKSNEEKDSFAVPGNRPYKKAGAGGIIPKPSEKCIKCGICASQCPTQAIDNANFKVADSKKCISCMRCVAKCPENARTVNKALVSIAGLAIKKACSVRKENELFL